MTIKQISALLLSAAMALSCAACGAQGSTAASAAPTPAQTADTAGETALFLSDEGCTVDGAAISADPADRVYAGADIVYYEDGHDETYGAGTEADSHSAGEAAAHTVVTITQPGNYRVSGMLSAGQLAVDLGEGAVDDPEAVVTLILDGVDITCTVAPAIIFYSVYECGSAEPETAAAIVDTSAAGANVILADGSENHVDGSYVAKIYREGTEKKLHKYDGAFYSKMSMNVDGESGGTGKLYITAANEGLDSELHLTINGGNISITAQNDGINTNEDNVSVTTVNGGSLYINAGLGDEGDGIDSTGYLVINGGDIVTLGNGRTGDGGLDAEYPSLHNVGTLLSQASRNDSVDSASAQGYLAFSFARTQAAGSLLTVSGGDGGTLLSYTAEKEYQSLTYSAPGLSADGTYTVAVDGEAQENSGFGGGMGGGPGGMGGGQRPGGMEPPEGLELPEGMERPEGDMPGQGPGGGEITAPT